MMGVLALLAGVLGMGAFWLVAWRLWQQALELEVEARLPASAPQAQELPMTSVEPAVPIAREHVGSGESTTFYRREELTREPIERTEILPEEANLPASAPGVNRR